MTDKQRFSSVWDVIEDTPQSAASMRARTGLMMSLTKVIRTQDMTQAQAAAMFGVTQQRISDLMRGKVNLFWLDTHDRHGRHGRYGTHCQGLVAETHASHRSQVGRHSHQTYRQHSHAQGQRCQAADAQDDHRARVTYPSDRARVLSA